MNHVKPLFRFFKTFLKESSNQQMNQHSGFIQFFFEVQVATTINISNEKRTKNLKNFKFKV